MDMTMINGDLQQQVQQLFALVKEQAEQFADQLTIQSEQFADQLDAQSKRYEELLAAKDLQIAKLEKLVKHYEFQILLLKRRQFGVSSERTLANAEQLSLFSEIEIPIVSLETEEITYSRKKRKGKREEDLSGLPVKRIDYELPENERSCTECGEVMNGIGVEVRRELELIPAKVIVVEHATHTYACKSKDCPGTTENGSDVIVKADAPKPLLAGSLASPSLVAHIVTQKYANGMPLYRLEKGFSYDGVVISRQNMANWVIKCAEIYLFAFYMLLISHLLKESVIHADETTHQVLREPNRNPQTKSYQWLYRTSGCSEKKVVIFDYQETRGNEHPQKFLKNYTGYLHSDGWQSYYALPENITVVGCWQHARSYFEKILKATPKDKREGSDAEQGVAYFNKLFDLERAFKTLSPEERRKKRLEESKPIAGSLFAWAESLLRTNLPKSPIGIAANYTLSQRKHLENVFLDGRLELSNNRAERSIKSFVMGRKAWLFSATPEGATASSVMYSIIETAKENNLHPYHYLKFLLETLPNTTIDNLDTLLPWSKVLPEVCYAPLI
jgi:transposase